MHPYPPSAVFVMPHFSDHPRARGYLDEAVEGLYTQTDPEWRLVIVDDASPRREDLRHLASLQSDTNGKITVLTQSENRGPGACRNIGIRWAEEHGADIVLFHDADDVSHPRRLDVTRQLFAEKPDTDFVYSTFTVIDEDGRTVPTSKLTPSVGEVLEAHRTVPVYGQQGWIRIGTETAYTTLTSTVAVRIGLALAQPFAEFRGSEDTHTWFRMLAAGDGLEYLPAIPSLYRISQDTRGSSDRARLGAAYYWHKSEHDTDGFEQAIDIATRRGVLAPERASALRAAFLRRLAQTMRAEGHDTIARELLEQAHRALQDGPVVLDNNQTTVGVQHD